MDKKLTNFNSHAHVERDGVEYEEEDLILYFNSHAHVERDFTIPKREELKNISTHTLTWSVTKICAKIYPPTKFQLTRSRGA